MSVSLEQKLNALPQSQRDKILQDAELFVKEYYSLQEFRKSIGWTQDELAQKLKISQANISKIEGRNDLMISTLKKYVEAMGYKMEINIFLEDDGITRRSSLMI